MVSLPVKIRLDAGPKSKNTPPPSVAASKSMLMYACKRCDIYFPIRRMLELHDCKSQKPSKDRFSCQYCDFSTTTRAAIASHTQLRHAALIRALALAESEAGPAPTNRVANDDDDENSWQVETLDENLPILAKVARQKGPSVQRKCPFCPFTSDNPSTHRSHVKRKHREDWLRMHGKENAPELVGRVRSCPHCPFETTTKSTLYSHINRLHKGKAPEDNDDGGPPRAYSATAYTAYACSYCTFAAATMWSLKYHSAREHGEQKRQPVVEFPADEFDCEQCDFKSSSRKIMQRHLKTSHKLETNEEGMFACHMCSYESTSKTGVQRHISIKHDKPRREAKASTETKAHACTGCDYLTYNAKVLAWHSKQHANSETVTGRAYVCDDCDFSTWTKGQMLTHIKRNHKPDEVQEEVPSGECCACDHCDYVTKNKHVLKVHVLRKHTEGFNHACELCGKKYKVKADLTNHMRFQHREQPIICDVCGKTCRNSNLLYLHQKFAHYKPEFECPICHRRMVSQANLDEHVVKQHEQRQDVVCEECGKSFSRQSRLKVHMRTHLGLRPYTCKVCGKSFARRNGLRQHLLIHTGKRPYVCDICGKDFTQKTGLISHRKSHPGSHPPLPRVTIDHVLSGLINDEKP